MYLICVILVVKLLKYDEQYLITGVEINIAKHNAITNSLLIKPETGTEIELS